MTKDDHTPRQREQAGQDAAANVIRSKLNILYASEPSAKEEIAEVRSLEKSDHAKLSKHQRFMASLSGSGRSLAEIQVAWHEYYAKLPADEKHAVWQEFYQAHEQKNRERKETPNPPKQPSAPLLTLKPVAASGSAPTLEARRPRDPKQELLRKITKHAQKEGNPHLRSLIFGLGMGSLVVLVLLFSFFNERFITPFIRPSHNVSATPIIVDPNASTAAGPEPKIIIPKINIEAPVVYDEPSIDEKAVQSSLERGVLHYATTPNPGEKGNAVIFGHSSSNILNKGKYKFAFLLLKSLENNDTFIVQKDGKKYVYKVYEKFVTTPDDLSVLGPTDKTAIITLITCDPPGLSTNRLIVRAEQIFPDPAQNAVSSVDGTLAGKQPEQLAGNAPSLWQRIKNWF